MARKDSVARGNHTLDRRSSRSPCVGRSRLRGRLQTCRKSHGPQMYSLAFGWCHSNQNHRLSLGPVPVGLFDQNLAYHTPPFNCSISSITAWTHQKKARLENWQNTLIRAIAVSWSRFSRSFKGNASGPSIGRVASYSSRLAFPCYYGLAPIIYTIVFLCQCFF